MIPVDYSLCDQTVTVYRRQGNGVNRWTVKNCYYSWRQEQTEDESGVRRETKCLLIMPGKNVQVRIGDRVYEGTGPYVDVKKWGSFLPATVPGLAQINYVTPYYWEGELCHIEAGRK